MNKKELSMIMNIISKEIQFYIYNPIPDKEIQSFVVKALQKVRNEINERFKEPQEEDGD